MKNISDMKLVIIGLLMIAILCILVGAFTKVDYENAIYGIIGGLTGYLTNKKIKEYKANKVKEDEVKEEIDNK